MISIYLIILVIKYHFNCNIHKSIITTENIYFYNLGNNFTNLALYISKCIFPPDDEDFVKIFINQSNFYNYCKFL